MSYTAMDDEEYKPQTLLSIKCGAPILMLPWHTINLLIQFSYVLNGINLFYAICLIYAAIQTKNNIGDFLNMVTDGDGTALSIALALSGTLALPLHITMLTVTYRMAASRRYKNRVLNTLLFSCVLVNACIVIILLIMAIYAIGHSYSLHHRLHDGICDAMSSYKNNSKIKIELDVLQITFQCCGSKMYSEWFTIPWFDTKSADVENKKLLRDDTPFSCCSMSAPFPCIHHDILSVGNVYLYAPETNLSISEHGCHPVLLRHTKIVAWKTAVALFGFAVLQVGLCIIVRLIQTSHTEKYRFEVNSHWHTAWLFGFYRGKKPRQAPIPPPLPHELRD